MSSPLLSICIPTYNRSLLLEQSLKSIIDQISADKLGNNIEIIISDNNSPDSTEEIVRKYKKKYNQLKYFKNKKNIGIINTIKVADYATGKYIWFFSDDDWQKPGALKTVIEVIKQNNPDLILVNLDLYSKNGKKHLDPNLLRTDQENFYGQKKEFFKFLENKFFLPIDWYMTSYSNTILRADLFNQEKNKAIKYYNSGCLFPHTTFFYYSVQDYSVTIIGKPIIKFRADNRSFGSKDKNKFLIDWYKTLRLHYDNIYAFNKKYISWKFTFLLFVKQGLRSLRLKFLLLFGLDISDILIKLFYNK